MGPMPTNRVTIRPLLLEDLDEIIALKGDVLRRPRFDPLIEKKIYEWELRNNPYRREEYPFGFVLHDENRIVGSVVLVPARFKVGDKTFYGCFEIDLMVLPEYRFHGLKLLNATWREKRFPIVVSTTLNETSYALEKKLGAKDTAHTKKQYIKITGLSRGLTLRSLNFKNLILYVKALPGRFSRDTVTGKGLDIKKVSRFDSGYDDLFNRVSPDYKMLHIRDSMYLNWRYVDFPYGERAIFSAFDNEGMIRGFIVVQKEGKQEGIKRCNIIDLFCSRGDVKALHALLFASEQYAEEEKLGRIEILPPAQQTTETLLSIGYIERDRKFPACIYKCSDDKFSEIASDARGWLISSGEGDTAICSALY